jgi:hypothetical protein
MANKFEEILTSGAEKISSINSDEEYQLQMAKLIYKRLENGIIRVATLAKADPLGNIPPGIVKEELLKL